MLLFSCLCHCLCWSIVTQHHTHICAHHTHHTHTHPHTAEPLVVLYNGVAVENDGNIQLDSELPGDLHLQCIGHYPSGFTSLQWISEEDGRDTMNLYEANSTGYISVSYSYNVANITINNRIRLFQGTLICRYDETNQVTITISGENCLFPSSNEFCM